MSKVSFAPALIGSTVSLISNNEVRYVGVLYSVDATRNTIGLAGVHCMGTEDRPTDSPVAPNEDLAYGNIVFKASDLKDLRVLEPPKMQPTLAGGLPRDPAIISYNVEPMHISPVPMIIQAGIARQTTILPRPDDDPRRGNRNRMFNSSRLGPASLSSGKVPPNSGLNGSNGARQRASRLKFSGDFDISKANEQFQTSPVERSESEAGEPDDSSHKRQDGHNDDSCYDKNRSFFDSISIDKDERPDWKREREINDETFGLGRHQLFRSRCGLVDHTLGRGGFVMLNGSMGGARAYGRRPFGFDGHQQQMHRPSGSSGKGSHKQSFNSTGAEHLG